MQLKAAIFAAVLLFGLAGAYYLSQSRTQLGSKASTETVVDVKKWEFNGDGNFEGWKYVSLSEAKVSGGVLTGKITKATATLTGSGLNFGSISSGFYRVTLRAKLDAGGRQPVKGGAELMGEAAQTQQAIQLAYKQKVGSAPETTKTATADEVKTVGDFQEYVFNLKSINTRAPITGFVFSFKNSVGKTLLVDSISLSSVTGSGVPGRGTGNGGACIAVISYAINPETGACQQFPTPCDIPAGWQTRNSCSNGPSSTPFPMTPSPSTPRPSTRPIGTPTTTIMPAPIKVIN